MKFSSLCIHTVALSCFAIGIALYAQDTNFRPERQLIPAPSCLDVPKSTGQAWVSCSPEAYAGWLKDIRHWRDERRIRIGYIGDRYAMPETQWTQSSFMQPQLMVQDRYFYDPVTAKYTVDRYLDDLEKRFGGIDAVLIWPTYPNMGIDDRNQHDMIRSMPGGIAGVRQMVSDFHRRGVRVLFPMMMWDQGTRDPGKPWWDAVAETMKEIGADGVNGDTQDGVPLTYSLAADKIRYPLVFQPEQSPHDEGLAWNLMTWGQYRPPSEPFPFVPGVDRYKWLEPRHMVNISDRWARDKTDDLQYAFFNGVGWESWENIWGIWNGITDRDAEATRRVATIERSVAPFLVSPEWTPHYPMSRFGVFSSRWPLAGQTVWTIVNRSEYDLEGQQMAVPAETGMHYYDLYHGVELTPRTTGKVTTLSFPIEAHGFGAILASRDILSDKLQALMARMKSMTASSLASFSHEWKVVPQTLVPIEPTKPAPDTPAGMVKIPAADYLFKVEGIEIEGVNSMGVDVQYPWEDSPRRFHEHRVQIKSFYIDKYSVTNSQFKAFLDTTHYRPKDSLNFLRDWANGRYSEGWADKPVTWVSLEDARAYAAWAGKRLPHEWEWQYAAQGDDGRAYPWGNKWQSDAVPTPDQGRILSSPAAVGAYPSGASPFGVIGMVGNVWQWTDEYSDDHTRGAILRGGSYYQTQGSMWYFPQAYRNDQHGKLLLMAPSMDRSGTVGFRCVRDAE
jgi:iron(II)-dependent oxidoreductase